MKTRRLPVLTAAVLGLCACTAFAEDFVKIGVFEPLTGANAAGGAEELDGIRLAQQHADVVTCRLTKQPRQDRTRFSVEVHRISSRPATRQYLRARRPTTLVT